MISVSTGQKSQPYELLACSAAMHAPGTHRPPTHPSSPAHGVTALQRTTLCRSAEQAGSQNEPPPTSEPVDALEDGAAPPLAVNAFGRPEALHARDARAVAPATP